MEKDNMYVCGIKYTVERAAPNGDARVTNMVVFSDPKSREDAQQEAALYKDAAVYHMNVLNTIERHMNLRTVRLDGTVYVVGVLDTKKREGQTL